MNIHYRQAAAHSGRWRRLWCSPYKLCSDLNSQPKRPGEPFDLESSVRVTCDVGYLCAKFSLSRPLCSRVTPDVRDRQTDVRQKHHLMPLLLGAGHNNDGYIWWVNRADDHVKPFLPVTAHLAKFGSSMSNGVACIEDRQYYVYGLWLLMWFAKMGELHLRLCCKWSHIGLMCSCTRHYVALKLVHCKLRHFTL